MSKPTQTGQPGITLVNASLVGHGLPVTSVMLRAPAAKRKSPSNLSWI